jgi:hypothetical protein
VCVCVCVSVCLCVSLRARVFHRYSSSLIPAAVDSFLSSSHLRRSRRKLQVGNAPLLGCFFLCVEFSFARTRDGCLFATIGRRFSELFGEEDWKILLFVVVGSRGDRRALLLFLLLFFFFYFFFFHFFFIFSAVLDTQHKKEIYHHFFRSKKRARTEYTRSRTEEEEDVRIERERERRASLARESPFFLSFFLYSIERDEKTRSLIVKIWIRRLRI